MFSLDSFSLEGKRAIVTGGTRGLCREIAQAYHDLGAQVVLWGRSGGAAEEAAEGRGGAAGVTGVGTGGAGGVCRSCTGGVCWLCAMRFRRGCFFAISMTSRSM